jgi:DedD protein
MAEEQKSAPEASTLKKRLLVRVGIAGAIIIALLATLALFESYTHEEPPLPPPPAPIAPTSPPEAQPAPAPAPEKRAEAPVEEMKPEPVAEPERTAPPVGPQRPVAPHREVPKAAEPAAPKAPEAPPAAKKPEEKPRLAPSPVIEVPRVAPGTPAGYVVQLGVFTNVTNAEELRAKLTLNSIPSQLETRVLAGPFKTKQEADAVQAKLKALGLDAGMLIPFPARK